MGIRIAALWRHVDDDGKKWTGGEISVDTGLVLVPGQKLICKIVPNDRKQPEDKFPDAYLEAWYPKPRLSEGEQATSKRQEDDTVPF